MEVKCDDGIEVEICFDTQSFGGDFFNNEEKINCGFQQIISDENDKYEAGCGGSKDGGDVKVTLKRAKSTTTTTSRSSSSRSEKGSKVKFVCELEEPDR